MKDKPVSAFFKWTRKIGGKLQKNYDAGEHIREGAVLTPQENSRGTLKLLGTTGLIVAFIAIIFLPNIREITKYILLAVLAIVFVAAMFFLFKDEWKR